MVDLVAGTNAAQGDEILDDDDLRSNPAGPAAVAAAAIPADDELHDLTTTVDPSYIIHLIRQLLPVSSEGTVLDTKHPVKGKVDSEGAAGRDQSKEEARNGCILEVPNQMDEDQAGGSKLSDKAGAVPVPNGPECQMQVFGADREQKEGLHKEGKQMDQEEAGTVLWDLAASSSHAEFLVEHRILDVLALILQSEPSDRLREISLGILGNLACHAGPCKAIVEAAGLLSLASKQLAVDDPPSLIEACRLFSAGLHQECAAEAWARALQAEETLARILWIAQNTAQAALLEKAGELLLAIVDSRHNVGALLLPSLLKLQLPAVLTSMLEAELAALSQVMPDHSDAALDCLLRVAEALSLSDDCAPDLAADEKLFSVACNVLRLSGRDEIGPSAISAAVLMANLLAEDSRLVSKVAPDGLLMGRLLALIPTSRDDPGACGATWSILGSAGRHLASPKSLEHMEEEQLLSLAEVLSKSSNLLMEDLNGDWDQQAEAEGEGSPDMASKHATVSVYQGVVEHMRKLLGKSNRSEQLASLESAASVLRNFTKRWTKTEKERT